MKENKSPYLLKMLHRKKKGFLQKSFAYIKRGTIAFGKFFWKTLAVCLLLFLCVEAWAVGNNFYRGVQDMQAQNVALAEEISQTRQYLLESCQEENDVRRYLFLADKNCGTYFPDLIEARKKKNLQEELLSIFDLFFLARENNGELLTAMLEEGKQAPHSAEELSKEDTEKDISFLDQFSALTESEELQKYFQEYEYALERGEENIVSLEKGGISVADIYWDSNEEEIKINLIEDQEILYLRGFSQRLMAKETQMNEEKRQQLIADLADIDTGDSSPRENILLLGRNGGNVDTIIFTSIDHVRKRITMVSLPRDLWVEGQKVNALHWKFGMKVFESKLEELLGQKIHHYVLIDMMAFPEVVDAMGGIYYTFDQPLIDPSYRTVDNGEEGTLFFSRGTHHLNGIQALRVARTRKTSSDFARASRQQEILKHIQKKGVQMGSVERLLALSPVVFSRVETDITPREAVSIFWKAKDYEVKNGNVMSTQNILVSEMFDLGKGSRIYILKPKDDDWSLIPKFVWSKLLN